MMKTFEQFNTMVSILKDNPKELQRLAKWWLKDRRELMPREQEAGTQKINHENKYTG